MIFGNNTSQIKALQNEHDKLHAENKKLVNDLNDMEQQRGRMKRKRITHQQVNNNIIVRKNEE